MSPTETLLAQMLNYGTWISTCIIFLGLAMAFAARPSSPTAMQIVSGGIALLILLPTFRVILMLGAFVRRRDYRFAAFAAFVLIIILLGFALGAKTARGV